MWSRVDDQVPHHPKFTNAGPIASWLWVCGNCHCNKYLTDGFIEDAALQTLGNIPSVKRHAATLVSVGLWERVDGGFHVHDYHDHNPKADQIKQKREKDRDRKRGEPKKPSAESARIPDGIAAESIAIPCGVAADSNALAGARGRARTIAIPVPPHVDPTEKTHVQQQPADVRREIAPIETKPPNGNGNGHGPAPLVTAGAHRKHAMCGRVCLPADLFDDFVRFQGGDEAKAGDDVREFFRGWNTRYSLGGDRYGDTVNGDIFAFWRARWGETHPAEPKPAKAAEILHRLTPFEQARRAGLK